MAQNKYYPSVTSLHAAAVASGKPHTDVATIAHYAAHRQDVVPLLRVISAVAFGLVPVRHGLAPSEGVTPPGKDPVPQKEQMILSHSSASKSDNVSKNRARNKKP